MFALNYPKTQSGPSLFLQRSEISAVLSEQQALDSCQFLIGSRYAIMGISNIPFTRGYPTPLNIVSPQAYEDSAHKKG